MLHAPTESTPEEILSHISLLLVEDDAITAETLARFLSKRMAKVLKARDGAEGLKMFREHRPDIVMADINMPVMDGLSMAAIIKTESPDTPVIAVTAHTEDHVLRKALEVGLEGYVTKPLETDTLIPVLFRNARVVAQRKREDVRSHMFSYLLDINPHLIVSCQDGRLDYANLTFLQYMGHDSLESLLSGKPGTMRDIFVAGARYPVTDFAAWMGKLHDPNLTDRTACFSASGGECFYENTFWVSSRSFPELGRDIVTFTDITPLERERVQLLYRATTDSLTGVSNRYKLTEYINAEHTRFKRYGMPLSLIMVDIDHFKVINDTHGHSVGDDVLVELAGVMLRDIRDTDSLGRWGGEEFLIVTPITSLEDAMEFAERMRANIERKEFPTAGRVTCSFGVVELGRDESVQELLQRVDAALYKAKNNGRNRVETI